MERWGVIAQIEAALSRLRTTKGTDFPPLRNPLKVEPVSALPQPMVDQTATAPATTGGDLSHLQSNVINTGQVNQMTGLTGTQEALLSPDEKLIAQRQNQRQRMTGTV